MVELQRLTTQIQPLQGCDFSLSAPRVARSAQPGAESFNPFGIENQCRCPKHLSRYSNENVEEPKMVLRGRAHVSFRCQMRQKRLHLRLPHLLRMPPMSLPLRSLGGRAEGRPAAVGPAKAGVR